jgi:hypothetical protein
MTYSTDSKVLFMTLKGILGGKISETARREFTQELAVTVSRRSEDGSIMRISGAYVGAHDSPQYQFSLAFRVEDGTTDVALLKMHGCALVSQQRAMAFTAIMKFLSAINVVPPGIDTELTSYIPGETVEASAERLNRIEMAARKHLAYSDQRLAETIAARASKGKVA